MSAPVTASRPALVDKLGLLRQSFPGLTEPEVADLAAMMAARQYPAGSVLCHEGAEEDSFFIIAAGEVLVTQSTPAGETRVLRRLGVGDYVGEMALIQHAPRAATVRTLTDCTVLEMGQADFEAVLGRSPRLALSIMRTTLARLSSNDQMAIDDLQRTNRLLAQLDRNKLEFIDVAAHELRTPLTVMKGYLNVLRLDPALQGNAQLEEIFDGLTRGTERLHEIVNTMLDVSRVDRDLSGRRLSVAPVPIKSMVNDLVRRVRNEAAARQLTFVTEHAPDVGLIQADPTLLQKALYQVLLNAVKYTPDGGQVTVRTRPVAQQARRPGVEISVQDTGIGLDREHHELIFEKFYQAGSVALHSSSKTAFKGGGPGLGLAVASGVVRVHGGRIWVESEGNDEARLPGCTFYIWLPEKPGPDDGRPATGDRV